MHRGQYHPPEGGRALRLLSADTTQFFGVGIGAVWQVGWAYEAKISVVETHQTAILNKVGLPEMSKHAIKCKSASSVFFILDIFEMSTLLCW